MIDCADFALEGRYREQQLGGAKTLVFLTTVQMKSNPCRFIGNMPRGTSYRDIKEREGGRKSERE